MATANTLPPAAHTVAYDVPLFGPLARALSPRGVHFPFVVIVLLVAIWGLAIFAFGLPALALPAVVGSILFLALLVVITFG